MKPLRVLAIAYACNPYLGSESGVGWGWVKAIADNHNVTVVTADYNAGDINRYLDEKERNSSSELRFVYVKNRPWHYRPEGVWLKIEGSLAKPLMNVAYQNWLQYAFQQARDEVALHSYDLVHLITYVGWRFPGRFYQLGIPFVWGPIGGVKNTPWKLLPLMGLRGAIHFGARNLVNSLQIKTLPGPRRALKAAGTAVIAATSEIHDELSNHFGVKSHVICEVGQPPLVAMEPSKRAHDEPFKVCWSGQHLPGKALHLLLRAAARLPTNLDYSIEILGDGPSNSGWRALADKLQLDNHCHWLGWLPREKSLEVMRTSHMFVITSLKDLTSSVAVEAISLGLPVVCLAHCGFADLVTDQCGIKVPVENADQIVAEFARAILRLYTDEALRYRLAQGAITRSAEYSWIRKMDSLNEVYSKASILELCGLKRIVSVN